MIAAEQAHHLRELIKEVNRIRTCPVEPEGYAYAFGRCRGIAYGLLWRLESLLEQVERDAKEGL